MPVPSTMSDLSLTAASNSPAGSDPIGNTLDDYIRAHAAIVRSTNALASASIASASTTNIGAADAESVEITGTTTITSFGTAAAGLRRECRFSGALTITHSANIQLPGAANYTTAVGDVLTFRSLGSGQWIMTAGSILAASKLIGTLPDARLSSNVPLKTGNNEFSGSNDFQASLSGGIYQVNLRNLSNTASSESRLIVGVAGASAADPYILWDVTGVTSYRAGIDNSDSDIFKIQAGGLGGTAGLSLTSSNVVRYDGREVGFRGGEFNTQSGTTYTFQNSDNGRIVNGTNGSAKTFTLPVLAAGTIIGVENHSGTDITISRSGTALFWAGTGSTNANRNITSQGMVVLSTPDGTNWHIGGSGIT